MVMVMWMVDILDYVILINVIFDTGHQSLCFFTLVPLTNAL